MLFYIRDMLLTSVVVPDSERSFEDHDHEWYLFNDFVVRGITEEEALSIPSGWKVWHRVIGHCSLLTLLEVPCVLYLERTDLVQRLEFGGLPMTIDQAILCRDTNIAMSVLS